MAIFTQSAIKQCSVVRLGLHSKTGLTHPTLPTSLPVDSAIPSGFMPKQHGSCMLTPVNCLCITNARVSKLGDSQWQPQPARGLRDPQRMPRRAKMGCYFWPKKEQYAVKLFMDLGYVWFGVCYNTMATKVAWQLMLRCDKLKRVHQKMAKLGLCTGFIIRKKGPQMRGPDLCWSCMRG
ncbi:hypothetical protein EWB00_000347 [Schistosoma japonicum]|uniref:Uncharacterized protein n=1 Tax=Schistosoma japonicum TaxID=6182 RepID=A0A4Z2CKA5_SCHJA|nr:hypothetical protein EWB00_000347 [Schistosoma japonicum]